MVSLTADYALRAMLLLAKPETARALSRRRDRRRHRRAAQLHGESAQRVAKAGLITSARGPTGGFTLAVPAREITLGRVIDLFDAAPVNPRCMLGSGPCDPVASLPRARCLAGSQPARAVRRSSHTTIADLLEGRVVPHATRNQHGVASMSPELDSPRSRRPGWRTFISRRPLLIAGSPARHPSRATWRRRAKRGARSSQLRQPSDRRQRPGGRRAHAGAERAAAHHAHASDEGDRESRSGREDAADRRQRAVHGVDVRRRGAGDVHPRARRRSRRAASQERRVEHDAAQHRPARGDRPGRRREGDA